MNNEDNPAEDNGPTNSEMYSIYVDERHKAISWEYSEVDKSENRQFVTCVLTIITSIAIVFLYKDPICLCIISITTGVASLIAMHVSSVLSQQGIRYYREEIIGPTMEAEAGKKRVYEKMCSMVDTANTVASCLAIASLITLALRCIQEAIW